MSFSKLFYKNNAQDFMENEITFEKSSLNSIILKRKRKLIKKMQYIRALQIPNSKDFKEYLYSSNNEMLIYLIWIKTNLIDFYHDALFFYKYKLSSLCTDQTCKEMSVGHCRIYICSLNKSQEEPPEDDISPQNYINENFIWMHSILNDKDFLTLSSDEEIKNYNQQAKLIVKRIFRFYGHCHYRHLKEIKENITDFTFFSLSMRFFVSFALKYNLIDSFEFEPLKMVISPFAECNFTAIDEKSDSEQHDENQYLIISESD